MAVARHPNVALARLAERQRQAGRDSDARWSLAAWNQERHCDRSTVSGFKKALAEIVSGTDCSMGMACVEQLRRGELVRCAVVG